MQEVLSLVWVFIYIHTFCMLWRVWGEQLNPMCWPNYMYIYLYTVTGVATTFIGFATTSIGFFTTSIGFSTTSIGFATTYIGFATTYIGFATT